jgi:uncharacterized OsmC-like protein
MPILHVTHDQADRFSIVIRDHQLAVDQPVEDGGDDLGPAPVELFVAGLAACVAFYVRRWLVRHGLPDDPLAVTAQWSMGTAPARVDRIRLRLTIPPAVPTERHGALLAVAAHCTVHNTLSHPPDIAVDIVEAAASAA